MEKVISFLKSGILLIATIILLLAPFGTFFIQNIKTLFIKLGYPLSNFPIIILTGWKELLLILGCTLILLLSVIQKKLPFKLNHLDWFFIIVTSLSVIYGFLVSPEIIPIIFGLRYDFLVFIFYFLGRSLELRSEGIKKLFTNIILLSLPIFIFGLMQTLVLPQNFMETFGYSFVSSPTGNPLPPQHLIGNNIVRAMSTFPGPNSLGMYSTFIFLLTLFVGKNIFKKWQTCIILLLSLASLIATFSRSHFFGLITALLLGFLFFKIIPKIFTSNKIKMYSLAFTVVILGLAIALTLSISLLAGMSKNQKTGLGDIVFRKSSTTIHSSVRTAAWTEIKKQPFGHGLGSAGLATTNTKGKVFNPESWPLQMVYEFGWLGLIMILTIIYGVISFLLKIYSETANEKTKWLVKYFFVSFTAIFLSTIFLPSWFEAASIIWWIIFGLFVSNTEEASKI